MNSRKGMAKKRVGVKLKRVPGPPRRGHMFVITHELSEKLTRRSEDLGLNRSELVERGMQWLEDHWDSQLQREIGGEVEVSDE